MSSGCTGSKVNYSIPQIVRCSGFIQYCADAGKLRHFKDVSPDGSGKEDKSLSGTQFKEAIKSLNDELDEDGTCLVYNIITNPGIISNGISSVIYENVQTFADTGNGGEGF